MSKRTSNNSDRKRTQNTALSAVILWFNESIKYMCIMFEYEIIEATLIFI